MSLLPGRLGLEKSRIPYVDRHGLVSLERGNLHVNDGCLHFLAAESDSLAKGDYAIPYQNVSMILLGPGTTVTHDVFRLLARHGTLLAFIGVGGVKLYTAPPFGRGNSDIARIHATLWANEDTRLTIARKMYLYRFGQVLPHREISVLRGIEGSRAKKSYRIIADQYGITWKGRLYDRSDPTAADLPNQAINHAATIVEAVAEIAVSAVGALAPLGFIHERSSNSFTLDIADLWRTEFTLPLAFSIAAKVQAREQLSLEREIRKEAAKWIHTDQLIPNMINRIKDLLNGNDDCSNA